jgi:hypothetical protein
MEINFGTFRFGYESMIIEHVSSKEICEVYTNVIILESENIKYPVGAKVEQLTIGKILYFDTSLILE